MLYVLIECYNQIHCKIEWLPLIYLRRLRQLQCLNLELLEEFVPIKPETHKDIEEVKK